MKLLKSTMSLLPLFFFGATSSAYYIDIHKKISARATEELRYCQSLYGLNPAKELKQKSLIWGSVFEDINQVAKIYIWHLYNPDKDLGGASFGIGYGSCAQHVKNLSQAISDGKGSFHLGQILHYLQDSAVPAHVAPIFHTLSDNFDNYDENDSWPEPISEQHCGELMASPLLQKDYPDQLEYVARTTLSRIQESFTTTTTSRDQLIHLTWAEAFWNPNFGQGSFKKNYGRYGEFGNQFGQTSIGQYQVPKVEYQNFAKRQFRLALDASILAMLKYSAANQPLRN